VGQARVPAAFRRDSYFADTLASKLSEEEVRRLTDQLHQEKMCLQGEVEVLHGHGEIIGNPFRTARR
jgi:hypothetical protein